MKQTQNPARPRYVLGVGLSIFVVLTLFLGMLPQSGMAANPTATATKKISITTSSKTPTATPKTSNKSTNTGPTIMAGFLDNYVQIEVSNFPGNTVYYVRTNEGSYRGGQWYHLGRLRTNRNGKASAAYRLPEVFNKAGQINICVKNVWTDATLCQAAWK